MIDKVSRVNTDFFLIFSNLRILDVNKFFEQRFFPILKAWLDSNSLWNTQIVEYRDALSARLFDHLGHLRSFSRAYAFYK